MKKIVKNYRLGFICVMIVAMFSSIASADVIIFPAKGQTPAQQQTDESACRQWATQNTGVDPVQIAQQPAATPAPQQGRGVRGAARGAVLGVAVGAIAGDAGKGAAIGATVGGVGGAARQSANNQAQQQAANQSNQDRAAQMDKYNRAFEACMEGKGYTIK